MILQIATETLDFSQFEDAAPIMTSIIGSHIPLGKWNVDMEITSVIDKRKSVDSKSLGEHMQ
jgi:hypothetical protein